MPQAPCPFTEADVKRLIHAVTAAGYEVHGVKYSRECKEITVITNKDTVKISGQDVKTITPEELLKLI
jgi:hypothetical protein